MDSAVRYHINPETGAPGKCAAKVRCRFGGEDEHFATQEAARESFEKLMTSTPSYFSGLTKRENDLPSGASCKICKAPLTQMTHSLFMNGKGPSCTTCGQKISVSKLIIPPLEKSAPLLTLAGAQATTFFHAAGRRNWSAILKKKDAILHMGEQEAAVDRALTFYGGRAFPTAVWGFYELRLKPQATFGKRFTDVGVGIERRIGGAEGLKGDYNPYVNHYEAPGTVSALVKASAVEIVGVRPVRFQELFEAPSLYTLARTAD